MAAERRVIVEERFCGPPGAGNGGYVAGIAAGPLGDRADVTLHRPTPLGTPLALRPDGERWRLEAESGGDPLVVAQPVGPVLPRISLPTPPAFEEAACASERAAGDHPFPHCFVCGPARAAGDGLRILSGPVTPGRYDCVASPWIPDATLSGDGRRVDRPFLWSALDCSGAAVAMEGSARPVLLARMTAEIRSRVAVGERCVVIGWRIDRSGRKHTTGTALFGADGRLCGASEQLWIEPRREAA